MLQDGCGRNIRYLRLSLTDACGMRCMYCRPDAAEPSCDGGLLTPVEIESLVRHLVVRHGLQKVRLTGGEPASRKDLVEIIRRIGAIPGVRDLAMTTNGLTLARCAEEYAAAGLRRVNVSLDSLDARRFKRMTGVDGLERVLKGLEAAAAAGLAPIRLNTVVIRGENEQELSELLVFAAERGLEIRFIELMPMGPLAAHWHDRYVPEADMREQLAAVVESWSEVTATAASSRRFRVTLARGVSTANGRSAVASRDPASRSATIGFITPMSCNFCARCDRIRVGSDGTIFPCLMDRPAGSILPALRPALDASHLDQFLTGILAAKAAEHPSTGFAVMQQIGG